MKYLEFLKTKVEVATVSGFSVDPKDLSPVLKPHQRDAVCWAVAGGRRALFESFGLGKTLQELEYCRLVLRHEGGKALIVLPLGVRQEFKRDAVQLLGMEEPQYITSPGEADELLSVERAGQLLEEEAEVGLGKGIGQVVVATEARSLGHVGKKVVHGADATSRKHLLQVLAGVGEVLKIHKL